jgi:transposase
LLIARIRELEEAIKLLKNNRNSNTSSTPPSHDYGRSNQKSLRKRSGKKSGGQQGHVGSNLELSESPDKTIEYKPQFCKECGEELKGHDFSFVLRKQEVILPPINPVYVEHQSYSCKCGKCGSITISELPPNLKSNIQYGDEIKALVVYLSVYQYLSYNRIAEFLDDFLKLPISEGTIDNILKECRKKSEGVYEQIRQKVENSFLVGGDETGIKINGKKGWLFTFQNEKTTFLTSSMSRGFDTINGLFKNGFPKSTYVSDCLAAQLKVKSKNKQLCTSHLQRELQNFITSFNCEFSSQLNRLIEQAIELKYRLAENDYSLHKNKVKYFKTKLDKLLDFEYPNKHRKILAFIKRLRKYRGYVFTFLEHPEVPPDNNGSERAIRNAKVKMKVSGQFKSLTGAETFAILRSIIDTAKKNSQNVFEALSLIPKIY